MNEILSDSQTPIVLRSGSLTCIYNDGMIRSIRCGSTEIVRRIYLALRDQYWNTIPFTISDFNCFQNENNFSLRFHARHSQNDIDFLWKGMIEGNSSGTLCYSFDGEALSSFKRNRIGFCVLLPLSLKGKPVTVLSTDAAKLDTTFPVTINPHQPVRSIRQIGGSFDSIAYKLSFDGDIFEMEDQRNWTDASFKVYSTPLDIPIPAIVKSGDRIKQSVTVQVKEQTDHLFTQDSPVQITVSRQSSPLLVPDIGLTLNPDIPEGPQALELFQALSLTHYRVDIYSDDTNSLDDLKTAAEFCHTTKSGAEIALHCENATDSFMEQFRNAILLNNVPVRRFCVYDENRVTGQPTLQSVVPLLKEIAPEATIASGTDSYYVELNRNHPWLELADELCYSANPQVHTFDNIAVMENLEGISETLNDSIRFNNDKPSIITPLTLRPRKNRKIPLKAGGSDYRQNELFTAAWTIGAVIQSIIGNAESLTLYDTAGDNGCMNADGSTVYPAYIALLWFSGLTRYNSWPVHLSCQGSVTGILIDHDNKSSLILVNLTDKNQLVTINGLSSHIVVKSLHDVQVPAAVSAPIAWNSIDGESYLLDNGSWNTEFFPYEIRCVKLV